MSASAAAYPEQQLQEERDGVLPPDASQQGASEEQPQKPYSPQQKTAYPQPRAQYPPTTQALQYGQQPPPYQYPQGQGAAPAYQLSEANLTVIHQPAPAAVTNTPPSGSHSCIGTGLLVYALMITFCFAFFGCWFALPCTIAGAIFAANASSSKSNGNVEGAKQRAIWSIGCTSAGIITAVIGFIFFIIVVIIVVIISLSPGNAATNNGNTPFG